jgi:aryl-alcohol dehydrogenase-like predicted oxidoreductase
MEDPDWIFGPDGAIEAVVAARQAGKVRYVGFTGHKDPAIHLKMLHVAAEHGFAFDAVQMPLSLFDHHYEGHSFERQVLPTLVERGIGVLGMKPLAGGRIPATGVVGAVEALHYAMSLPTSVVITGCDSLSVLDQALEAARTFQPLSQEETASILARTAGLSAGGELEPFKTTQNHDSTTRHPEWMWGKTA